MAPVLPFLVVFNLDYIIVPFSTRSVKLPFKQIDDITLDQAGTVMKHFPEVPAIFQKLKETGIKIAVTYHHKAEKEILGLIELFGWEKYISYKQIQNIWEEKAFHLNDVRVQAQTTVDKMIFFGSEPNHIEESKKLKIFAVKVDPGTGMTLEILENGLKKYDLHLKEEKKKKSEIPKLSDK